MIHDELHMIHGHSTWCLVQDTQFMIHGRGRVKKKKKKVCSLTTPHRSPPPLVHMCGPLIAIFYTFFLEQIENIALKMDFY